MEAPAGIGEAVLGAVAFATERFLRDEAWHDRIDEVLGHLGSAAAVSRAYLFQNTRGPDGRARVSDLRSTRVRVAQSPGDHFPRPFIRPWVGCLSGQALDH